MFESHFPYEASNTPHEPSERGSESFQPNAGGAELTPLTPSDASPLDAQPERLPEAAPEGHEAPEHTAAGERLQQPEHVVIRTMRGEPLPREAVAARLQQRGVWLPRQTRMFEDEKQVVTAAREGFKDMALEAGVDIHGNAPTVDAADFSVYHPYNIPKAFRNDLAQVYGQRLISAVQALQHPEIGVMYTQDSPQRVEVLARMTVRDMSHQVLVDLDPRGDYPEGSLLSVEEPGYYPDGTLLSANGISRTVYEEGQSVVKGQALNDLAVDLAAVRLDRPYSWQLGGGQYTYHNLLTAAVIDEAVRRQGMDAAEMEDILVRGLVAGDPQIEEVLADSFGSDGLGLAMQLSERNALEVEHTLGLSRALERVRNYAHDGRSSSIDIYPWREERE